MIELSASAPAKINLSLRIVGRREDGYHLLDSIFVPITFYDRVTIHIAPASTLFVRCDCENRPDLNGDDNLAARAAKLFCQASGITADLQIRIEKQIWSGAGLGGGSTDAAAVLRLLSGVDWKGLAQPGQIPTSSELDQLAAQLGADVPFFLRQGPQRAQGIGVELSPVTGLPCAQLVLVKPDASLSTVAVYRQLGYSKGCVIEGVPAQPETLSGNFDDIAALLANDLTAAAKQLCPAISEAELLLKAAGARHVGMSGSGATMFALCQTETQAQAIAFKATGTKGFSVQCCQFIA